ncbi:MAG: ribonuclease E/G, partial [Alphaproteobacteria bacterium]|nr:ribonuclease E/G [Alphaproteobacteria bacterium]
GGDRPAFLPNRELAPRDKQLHEGERVIVQIRREAQGGKAARVTMKLLPTLVLPGSFKGKVEGAAEIEISAWHDLLDRASRLAPPARLGPEASFAAALAASLPGGVLGEILTDDPAAIPEIRAAFPGITASHRPDAEGPTDFDAVFDEALANSLALQGRGCIHFETSRAGMLIDVDTGSPETGSPEQSGLAANLAAARTIARQLRLRNLGGGIIVDFVGLDSRAARDRVRAAFAEAVAPDPSGVQLLGWTRLGHFELVRPRRGRPLAEALLEPRPGGALVKTAVTVAHETLRALRRAARAQPGRKWRLTVAPEVRAALTGPLADAVRQAEERFARSIVIDADPGCNRERFQISPR